MAAPVSPQVLPDEAVVITLLGRKYLFVNREEARKWMQQPISDWEAERWKEALERIERTREHILQETNGRGITDEDIDEALREARDH